MLGVKNTLMISGYTKFWYIFRDLDDAIAPWLAQDYTIKNLPKLKPNCQEIGHFFSPQCAIVPKGSFYITTSF